MSIVSLFISAFLILLTVRPSSAQNSIADIISEKDKSPFEMTIDQLNARVAAMQKVTEAELLRLANQERALEGQYQSIQATGYTPIKYMAEFAELAALLPAELRAEVAAGNLVKLEGWTNKSEEARKLKEFVDAAKMHVGPFVRALDSYNVGSMDLAMALGILKVNEQALLVLENSPSRSNLKRLNSSFGKLDEKRQGYNDNKDLYGQPKGSFVLAPSNRFLGMLKAISKQMLKHIPGDPVALEKKNESQWKKIFSIVLRLPALARLIGSSARMYYHLKRHTPPTKEKVPFSSAIHDTFRNLGDLMGLEVKINNQQNFPLPKHENEIIILNATHRDSLKDFIAIANLKIDHVAYFGAAGNFIPNAYGPLNLTKFKQGAISDLNKNMSFVVVGKNKDNLNPVDSTEKALLIIKDGKIQIVILFSEGMLPSELGAISPIQEKSFSLIEHFRAAGKKVTLATMVFKNNHDPFDQQLTGSDNKRLEVDVFPAIPDHISGMLATFGGVEALSLLYRFGAVSSLITNEGLLFGQVRATKLEEALDKHMSLRPKIKVKSCLQVLGLAQ